MRICTNCGRILEDGETVCKVCSSSLILDTEGASEAREELEHSIEELYGEDSPAVSESDDTDTSAQSGGITAPDTPGSDAIVSEGTGDAEPVEISANSETETNVTDETAPDETREAASAEETAANGTEEAAEDHTAYTSVFSFTQTLPYIPAADEQEQIPAEEQPETSGETAGTESAEVSAAPADTSPSGESPERKENFRIVSVKVKNDDGLGSVNRGRVAAVALALLALISVIAATFMIVIPLVNARRQDEAAKTKAYMDFLCGQWLSETFIYSGKEFPSCELLTINRNNTFSTEIWTSPTDREKYDSETWSITAEQSGEFHLELNTSSLRVSYTDSDGNVMVYRRYILRLDAGSLVLREYYNEKMTDYYDVVFTRVPESE